MEAMNNASADTAISAHVTRARRSQRPRSVVADVEARVLIPPALRPCSLAPSVTTPLYSTTVCQTLRRTLRGSFSTSAVRSSQNSFTEGISDVCLYPRPGADFSRGCAHPPLRPPVSATPPYSDSQFANGFLASTTSQRLS